MKKKTKLDMSAIMARYTQEWIADEQRRMMIRDGQLPAPAPTETWDISDRD